MINNKPKFMSQRVRASVAAILGSTLLSGYAAQSFSAEEKLEEIQVTGSRITRRDLESNSPIVSIDNAALEAKSGLNIESYLNQLPAFNPAGSPTVKGGTGSNSDVQISAVSSVGIASISLRGFGPNRGLVLMDGHRATPTNALMVVDINSVPSSMIKRVEIISGGASATYGADAIAGVSNFILRKDFQGLEADIQQGITQAGDGQELRASALMGSKFADGRGNVVFAAEYYNREAAYEKNRDFYKKGWADPTVGGNFLGFVFGVNGYNPIFNSYSPAALAGILGKTPAQVTGANGLGSNAIRFNSDSSLFLQVGDNANTFKGTIDGAHYAKVNVYNDSFVNNAANPPPLIQKVKWNETEGYAGSPQTRYAFMGSGQYDLTDHLQFYSSARFAQSRTTTYLSGTNASFGWEATVPYNATTDSPVNPALNFKDQATVAAIMANPAAYANPGFIAHGAAGAQHPVPLAMAILLNSRGTAPLTSGWIAETYPLNSFASRSTVDENLAWQVEAGLKFDIPVKDWKGEIYYSRGESATYNVANGNNSLARWRGEVTALDYGYKSNLQSNKTNNVGANLGFGSVAVPCTSGFYDTMFKGDTRPSEDCLYAVNAPLQTRTENQQDIGELNFQGGLFNLPAGEVRAAVGYQYRRNASQFIPDILQSTASFTDQVIGVYPTGYLNAQTKVNDYYAELLVPVLSDTFVKKAELELGGRFSDYDQTDSTTTFKVNGNIEFNDYVRLRGGFNRANRAPNLGELYLNLQQIFTGAGTYGDPCSLISNSPFGAGGAAPNPWSNAVANPSVLAGGQTAAGAKSAYLICQAQMGAGATNPQGGYYTNSHAPGAIGGGGFAWVNQIGNTKLKSEIADTWTAGFVLRSPFEKPLLQSLTATFDWYQIGLKDAILPYSITYAQFQCYGAVQVTDAAGAAAQAASTACQNLPRSTSTGDSLTTLVSYSNQATVKTSGVDFTINWFGKLADMGLESLPGGISVNMQGTWLNYYKTKQSPASFDPVTDWKGTLGPNLQGFNAGAYSYRLFTNFSYVLPTTSFGLRWRHLPSVQVAARATEDAIKANNAAAAAGAALPILSYTPITNEAAPAYDAFDLSANWNITENFTVRAGIDNVLDTQPAITGKANGYPVGTTLSGVCNGAPGCVNPGAYSLGTTGQGTTNGGYYDVLGRRYFLGFKAKF
jgi:iron complex outermembrane recepter protein